MASILNLKNNIIAGGWMNLPQNTPNCPPGLEYLTMIDQLLVHQKVEVLEGKNVHQNRQPQQNSILFQL